MVGGAGLETAVYGGARLARMGLYGSQRSSTDLARWAAEAGTVATGPLCASRHTGRLVATGPLCASRHTGRLVATGPLCASRHSGGLVATGPLCASRHTGRLVATGPLCASLRTGPCAPVRVSTHASLSNPSPMLMTNYREFISCGVTCVLMYILHRR